MGSRKILNIKNVSGGGLQNNELDSRTAMSNSQITIHNKQLLTVSIYDVAISL